MWAAIKTKWQSLTFRLLFYFLISMVLIAMLLVVSFTRGLKPHLENEILPNVERYIDYIIADIGDPPDLQVAKQLAAQLPFEIRIEGDQLNWASNSWIKSISSYRFERAPEPYNHVFYGHQRKRQLLLIQRGSYQYLFVTDNDFRERSQMRHGVLFLISALILFLLYMAIRRLFAPIQLISQQVERIGSGDLETEYVPTGQGELGLLAEGVNRMSAQIKSMLESKSALLLAISHELRSPMTRMRVNLELLEKNYIRDKLVEDIRHMDAQLSAILEAEKLNNKHAPINRSECDLPALVEDLVHDHPCHNRIECQLLPLTMQVDRFRIQLLLKNLLDNACHYSTETDANILISINRVGATVVLTVSDDGIGIEKNDIPRLTEAFYRPDRARQRHTGGYGLGLYLCNLIAQAHGGELLIESEPGKGTRVSLILALTDEPTQGPSSSA